MCPDRLSPRTHQHGLGVIAAIFILVILAGLAGFIAVLSTTQQIGSALDVQGARAYQAARSGTEWALWHVLSGTPATYCAAAPGTTTALGALDGINVSVNCTTVASGDAVEPGLGALYTITATACAPPAGGGACPGDAANPYYVERMVTVLVER